jgi:glyoxylase-like metal-dependent hydrolase (beta-lactamase superfamily II)
MVAAYAVPAEGGVALVDAGLPGGEGRIVAALAEHGLQPNDIRVILVTHAHGDHIGGLAEIARLSGAPVLVHEADAPILEAGDPPVPNGLTAFGKAASLLAMPFMNRVKVTPWHGAIRLTSEHSLRDFGVEGIVIPTPGHTPGSLSLVMDSGDAFVGDLCSRFLPFGSALPPFGDDRATIAAGWRRVLTAGARFIYPGHGNPFPADNLREELDRLEWAGAGTNPLRVAVFIGLGVAAGLLTRRLLRRA